MRIKIENLNYSYSDKKDVLNNINLDVAHGEKCALIGPNGAGKSTLLLHLNGVLTGTGNIWIGDKLLSKENIKEIRQRVGLIFQDPNDQLFCPTVYDDIAFGPLNLGWDEDEVSKAVHSSLSETDTMYLAERAPHHLSIGERRRASIAAVIACKPNVLAFDEPAASLDPKHKRELIEFIKSDERTMLIASHDLELARKTCSKCALMNDGKIITIDDINNILSNSKLLEDNEL